MKHLLRPQLLLKPNIHVYGRRLLATKPNLTLFSGPTCSLCDTAKEILGRVQKERDFDLQTIDIHATGQEKWKRRYVYEIPVLHMDGKVIAKGRWNEESVISAIKQWKPVD